MDSRGLSCSYSPVVLKGILQNEHYQYWLLFVIACIILSSRIVSICNVEYADQFFVIFCKKFEQLYGKMSCNPSLHLNLHIKDCLLDCGLSHTYSFEGYNGILTSFHTNKKSVKTQIMRKFMTSQQIISKSFLAHCELLPLFVTPGSGAEVTSGDLTSLSLDDKVVVTMLNISTVPFNSTIILVL